MSRPNDGRLGDQTCTERYVGGCEYRLGDSREHQRDPAFVRATRGRQYRMGARALPNGQYAPVTGDGATSQGEPGQTPRFDFAEHVFRFNAAVQTGDWTQYIERFADDASLEFVGPPVGPFTGRAAIHEAYAQQPPDDKIELDGPVVVDSDQLVVPYRWARTGATGTMRVTERAGRIVRLVVTFN
jgi:steroid delta-isomerase